MHSKGLTRGRDVSDDHVKTVPGCEAVTHDDEVRHIDDTCSRTARRQHLRVTGSRRRPGGFVASRTCTVVVRVNSSAVVLSTLNDVCC